MKGGRSSGRAGRFALAAILLLTAAGTVRLIAVGTRGAEIAGVLAVPLAVLTLLVAVLDWKFTHRKFGREDLWQSCRELANEVAARERALSNRFLADTAKAELADVDFSRFQYDGQLVSWRGDGGAHDSSLTALRDFYAQLEHGRLVILGAAGAGKTVLLSHLLLDLAAALPLADPGPAVRVRVPVHLSLTSFDCGSDAEQASGEVLAERLDAWIAQHLQEVFQLGEALALTLVAQGWILPLLDGLDEMDAADQPPLRAAALARALNHPVGTGLRPVVLACRRQRYIELAAADSDPGSPQVLQDATTVELEPLSAGKVAAYVTARFPDPTDPSLAQPRWRPVLVQLLAAPTGPLAGSLSSPLGLFLAVTAYHRPETRPVDLTALPAAELDRALLDRLVPETCRQHPAPNVRGRYAPEDVTRWLGTLAAHLRAQQARGRSGTDLDMHLLWSAAGPRAPRYIAKALLGLAVATSVLACAAWYIHATGHLLAPGWRGRATFAAVAVFTALAAMSATAPVGLGSAGRVGGVSPAHRYLTQPPRLDLARLRTPGLARLVRVVVVVVDFAFGLAAGFVVGLATGFAFGPAAGFTYGLTVAVTYALVSGIAQGLAFGFMQRAASLKRPSDLVRQGVVYDVMVTLVVGLVVGLTAGLTIGGLAIGLAFGLAAGGLTLTLGSVPLMSGGSPWPQFFVAVWMLGRRGRLPHHTAGFLDWAYAAGLMRISGASIQFRHLRLQEHLDPGKVEPLPAAQSGGAEHP